MATLCVGVLLLLVSGCYAAANDARAAGEQQQRGAEKETWACGKAILMSCSNQLQAFGRQPVRTLRMACSLLDDAHRCVQGAVDNDCAENAHRLIQLATGTVRNAAENALNFVCNQHIDEFEDISECVIGKIQSRELALRDIVRCRQQDVDHRSIPDFCDVFGGRLYFRGLRVPGGIPAPTSHSLNEEYECIAAVIGNACGSEAETLINQLTSEMISDVGCSSNDALGQLKRRGLGDVAGLLRRALDK